MRKLRFGVLGAAKIAREKVIPPLQQSARCEVVALASRDGARGREVAAKLGIARVHDSYDSLLADPDIDAVYNPLPNHLHLPWTIKAAEAGKHVLCEKPLTVTLAESRALFAVARETGRVLLEAYPYRYQPQTLRMRQLIDEGAIGEVRLVQAFFGITLPPGPNIRLDAALGGGATLDLGCYAVSLARLAVGRRPLQVTAHALYTEGGVDLRLAGTIHYEGGAVAQVGCAMDCSFCSTAQQGFNSNLSTAEIVGQVLEVSARPRTHRCGGTSASVPRTRPVCVSVRPHCSRCSLSAGSS